MVELTPDEVGICLVAVIKAEAAARWRCIPDPWVDASQEEINQLLDKLGIPGDDETLLVCPACGREQSVPRDDYLMNLALGGHPYTCGGPTCPGHTVMQVVPKEAFFAREDEP